MNVSFAKADSEPEPDRAAAKLEPEPDRHIQGRPVKPSWRPPPPEHGDWTERYFVDDAVLPTPSAEEIDRGFMLYSRHFTSLIFDNSVPHGDDRTERLSCRASLGEYESVTFAAYALRDLSAVSPVEL